MNNGLNAQVQSGKSDRMKVLVVDQNLTFMEMLGGALSKDVDVLGLHDSWDAAGLIEQHKFDGIFLDLDLPGLDGLSLIRRVRNSLLNHTIPVVVVTAKGGTAMKDAFAAGAHFFATKPLDHVKLRRLLSSTEGALRRERSKIPKTTDPIRVNGRAESQSFTGTALEVSEQGLLFQSDAEFHPGELVRLSFNLPNFPLGLEAVGNITRTDHQHLTYCQFSKLDSITQSALEQFATA